MLFTIRRGLYAYLQTTVATLCTLVCGWLGLGGNLFLGLAFFPLALVATVGVAQLLRGGYYLGDGLMELKCGFQTLLIQYDSIETVSDNGKLAVNGYVPFAMHRDKLYVYYWQEEKTYRLELSPAQPQAFLSALEQKLGY